MSKNNHDGTSDIDNPDQTGVISQHKPKSATALENDLARRENAVMNDEMLVLNREKLVSEREGSIHLRETVASAREREIHAAELLLTRSGNHMTNLRQANANLVIAAIEAHKLTEQVESAKIQMDYLAHHDALTKLPNRVLLQDRLSLAIELARRQGGKLAVMFMDLDQFKYINDSLA